MADESNNAVLMPSELLLSPKELPLLRQNADEPGPLNTKDVDVRTEAFFEGRRVGEVARDVT